MNISKIKLAIKELVGKEISIKVNFLTEGVFVDIRCIKRLSVIFRIIEVILWVSI